MIRQSVKSTHIASAGFDARSRVMELQFTDGRVYQYPRIGAQQFLAFMSAPSKGAFFQKNWSKSQSTEVTPPQEKAASHAKPSFAPQEEESE